MIEQLLMSRPFRRYIEAWAIVLMPWVLLSERDAVTVMDWEEGTLSDGTIPHDKRLGFGPHTCDSACNHQYDHGLDEDCLDENGEVKCYDN